MFGHVDPQWFDPGARSDVITFVLHPTYSVLVCLLVRCDYPSQCRLKYTFQCIVFVQLPMDVTTEGLSPTALAFIWSRAWVQSSLSLVNSEVEFGLLTLFSTSNGFPRQACNCLTVNGIRTHGSAAGGCEGGQLDHRADRHTAETRFVPRNRWRQLYVGSAGSSPEGVVGFVWCFPGHPKGHLSVLRCDWGPQIAYCSPARPAYSTRKSRCNAAFRVRVLPQCATALCTRKCFASVALCPTVGPILVFQGQLAPLRAIHAVGDTMDFTVSG